MINWLKSVQGVAISILGLIGAIVGIYGYGQGWYGSIKNEGVSELKKQFREDSITLVLNDYGKYSSDKNLPYTLQKLYDARTEIIDSISFDNMQTQNILSGMMSKTVVYDNCQVQCSYWLLQDNNGGLWYRSRIDKDGKRTYTHLYSAIYSPTSNTWNYIDSKGQYQSLKHKWERTNRDANE